jgi:hypothetical protein
VADAPDEGELVLLETHPRPPAVAEAAAGQLGLDVLGGDGQTGGQAFDDDDQTLSVGLAGGEETEHLISVLSPVVGLPPKNVIHGPPGSSPGSAGGAGDERDRRHPQLRRAARGGHRR